MTSGKGKRAYNLLNSPGKNKSPGSDRNLQILESKRREFRVRVECFLNLVHVLCAQPAQYRNYRLIEIQKVTTGVQNPVTRFRFDTKGSDHLFKWSSKPDSPDDHKLDVDHQGTVNMLLLV